MFKIFLNYVKEKRININRNVIFNMYNISYNLCFKLHL